MRTNILGSNYFGVYEAHLLDFIIEPRFAIFFNNRTDCKNKLGQFCVFFRLGIFNWIWESRRNSSSSTGEIGGNRREK